MHRPIFGHSFAVLVAPVLLSVLAFKFLNKKKTNELRNAKDADPGASGLMTALKESESGGSSSSPTETRNGASIGNNYEVFLSFRGSDIRHSFNDHLYKGLCDAGIHTFRDNEELRQGEEIGPVLLAAIKNSKILIPILSVNYGESKWCLEELVQIMECKKNNTGHIVLPVFYKVAPADVRHQIGSFGEAFKKRERRERRRGSDSTMLVKWKQALGEVANLKGQEANGSEVELINLVVQQVLLELEKKFELVIPENLVGIDSHVKKLMEFVDNNSGATLFIGIHGMGGIGKTTLAIAIYNKLSDKFEHRSFIADTRESCERNGFEYLQNQLISDTLKKDHKVPNKNEGIRFISSKMKGKKVLILLDDVDKDDQWKALAGNHNWFSSGSIIIITTRNQNILKNADVDCNYELKEMDEETSLILFSRHAFQGDAPPKEFEVLTHNIVSATGGLPLCLEVLGSYLHKKEQLGVWEDMLKKLESFPPKEVQEKLRISYDALEYEQKQIFLDIACFFIGTDLRIASYMWNACGFFPKVGIEVLSSMSLVKVEENYKLRMHDQLRDLGREIVRLEAKKKLWNYSRLWDSEEALQLLKEDEDKKKIEAICLGKYSSNGACELTHQDGNVFTAKQFEKLRNLRFLEASRVHLNGYFNKSMGKLNWLLWQHCPRSFEANNLEKLAVLGLAQSKISDEWQGWNFIMMAKELKYLDLTHCKSLEKTSFLSAFEKLEVLILRDCNKIKQIDSSIENMKNLVRLDLWGCKMLERLPAEVGKLQALKHLFLSYSGVKQLPDDIGDLQNLETLHVDCTWIEKLPSKIGRLSKLRELNASGCLKLREMPESIHNLSSLQRLELKRCWDLQSVSVLPSNLKSLRTACGIPRLAAHSNQTHLEYIGEPPSELEILELDCCDCLEILDVSQFNHLRKLLVRGCGIIHDIRGLDNLEYLERLDIIACNSVKTLELPKSQRLKILLAKNCESLVEIRGLNEKVALEEIHISGCSIERLDLTKSEGLKELHIHSCKNLSKIQGLLTLESLKLLDMSSCTSFGRLPDLCCFNTLDTLAINCGDSLHNIHSLGRFPSCKSLWIEDCKSLAINLSNFCNLQTLVLSHCHELRDISRLEKSTSLESMAILGCSSIEILPDMSSCTNLVRLVVQDCEKLTELRGLEKLEQLMELDISGCESLRTIPELSRVKIYHDYRISSSKQRDAMSSKQRDAMTDLRCYSIR